MTRQVENGHQSKVAVFFGSETGKAEEVAWDIAREGRRLGFPCSDPLPLNEADPKKLSTLRTVIFVVSTTGHGDPPLNMRRFWQELLLAALPKTLLHDLRYAVFGLGDSHYKEFNYMARKLDARLLGLGASKLYRLGLGDDQHDFGLEQELDPWIEGLWPALATLVPARPVPGAVVERRFEVEELGEENSEARAPFELGDFEATVMLNESLCAQHDNVQDVRNVRLLTPPAVSYTAGDVCVVWPRPEPALIRRFVVETLGRSLTERVRIFSASDHGASCVFPNAPVTLEEVFTNFVDICAVPSRHFFHVLSQHTDHELHKMKLTLFGSRTLEAKDAVYEYCKRENRSAAEVMWDFWTARPPLPDLLNCLPVMRPRRYSIASSPDWHTSAALALWRRYRQLTCGDSIASLSSAGVTSICRKALCSGTFDLCVAVVRFTTKTGRECAGLCSSFLQRLELGDVVRCSFEPGSLSLPPMEVPLIMVCPGTGLSPCRALVQQRHLQALGSGSRGQRDLMFLGFRHRHGDFLYGAEWEQFQDWLAVHVAFSRDQEDRKVYVQDLIEQQGVEVCRLLDAGAHVYVCGRSHPMPAQVFDTFVEVLHVHRGMSAEAAASRLREMQRSRRYICDTWG